jgi:hypothetical protein
MKSRGEPLSTDDNTEVVRFKCSNPGTFTTWVAQTAHSLHVYQLNEGVNTAKGQIVSGGVFQVGSQTFMLATHSPGDTTTPAIYQIGLNIASTTLTNLVSLAEDAMPVGATDAFTGGAGSLGANWTDGTAALKVIAGPFVEATATNTACWDIYTGASFTDSQWGEAVVHAMANSSILEVTARATAFNWYAVRVTGNTGSTAVLQLLLRNNGSATLLGPSATVTLTAEDKIRIQVFNGSDGFPVLTAFQNGFSILQAQDYSSFILSGGHPGMYMDALSALTDVQVSSWSGGNAAAIPATTATTTFSPVAGSYAGTQSVTLSNTDSAVSGFAQ